MVMFVCSQDENEAWDGVYFLKKSWYFVQYIYLFPLWVQGATNINFT